MLGRMDGHALLGEIAAYATLSYDGGPRGYRRRGSPLPERHLPGRYLAGLRPDYRARVVEAVCDKTTPAPWYLRRVIEEDQPHWAPPPEPVDRRWARRGRWAMPPHEAPAMQAAR